MLWYSNDAQLTFRGLACGDINVVKIQAINPKKSKPANRCCHTVRFDGHDYIAFVDCRAFPMTSLISAAIWAQRENTNRPAAAAAAHMVEEGSGHGE